MSSRYCPFLIDRGGFLTTNYECRSSGKSFTGADSIYSTYCSNQDNYEKCPFFKPEPEQNGGCYLTTACVEARGLADDCEELTQMRRFRDGWLINQSGGQEEINHYYINAPHVVRAIHQAENEAEILDNLYREMVCPCVEAIRCGDFEVAHKIYVSKALEVEKQFLQ